MDFRILGPLEVRDDGVELPLGGGKQRSLLALLLLHPNESLSSDRLVDELWGEQPPPTAAKILQNHVSQLRRVLGNGRLQTAPYNAVQVFELILSKVDLMLARCMLTHCMLARRCKVLVGKACPKGGHLFGLGVKFGLTGLGELKDTALGFLCRAHESLIF